MASHPGVALIRCRSRLVPVCLLAFPQGRGLAGWHSRRHGSRFRRLPRVLNVAFLRRWSCADSPEACTWVCCAQTISSGGPCPAPRRARGCMASPPRHQPSASIPPLAASHAGPQDDPPGGRRSLTVQGRCGSLWRRSLWWCACSPQRKWSAAPPRPAWPAPIRAPGRLADRPAAAHPHAAERSAGAWGSGGAVLAAWPWAEAAVAPSRLASFQPSLASAQAALSLPGG